MNLLLLRGETSMAMISCTLLGHRTWAGGVGSEKTTSTGTSLFTGNTFLFLLGKHLAVKLLGCMVIVYLTLIRNCKLLLQVAMPFHIPAAAYENSSGSVFLLALGVSIF